MNKKICVVNIDIDDDVVNVDDYNNKHEELPNDVDVDDDDDDDRFAKQFKTELFEKSHGDDKQNKDSLKPVWFDEDDEIDASKAFEGCSKMPKLVKSNDNYRQYLERKFTEIHEPPNWARKTSKKQSGKHDKQRKVSSDDDDDDDDDDDNIQVDQIAYDNLKSCRFHLNKEFLRVKKCPHLNISSRIKTSLNCVNFHSNSTVALIGSPIGLVRLFQVDGKLNSIIQSIYFQGYRLCDAQFISANGQEEIIVGSDGSNTKCHGFCYFYDMLAGKIIRIRLSKGGKHRYSLRGFQISPNGSYLAACDQNGNINLLSASSKELIQEMKINGDVNCLSFSPDSNYIIAHGQQTGCQAFIFDIRNARKFIPCVNRFNDPDTIIATAMDLSPTGNLLAIGSNMGTINLYRFDDIIKQTNPMPIKSIMNLTTAISSLKFNHDGQLLLLASDQKNDAIRFLNTNSMTVYKNFPLFVGGNSGRTYGRIFDIDFSPHSGYASFVTGSGSGHLFRITEYSSY
nr:U3 small nucleolar RNA-associated protein 18 homolog [Dermatophagoides farinae]